MGVIFIFTMSVVCLTHVNFLVKPLKITNRGALQYFLPGSAAPLGPDL